MKKTHNETIYLSLTPLCNLSCSYCYTNMINDKQKKIATEDAVKTVKNFIEKSNKENFFFKKIVLHGRENTTIPANILASLINDLFSVSEVVSMQSNFVNFGNSDYFETFSSVLRYKDRFNCGTSLDGPKEINDINRGISYDNVIQGLKNYKIWKGIGASIICVLSSKTIKYIDMYNDWINDILKISSSITLSYAIGDEALTKDMMIDMYKYFKKHGHAHRMSSLNENMGVNKGNQCKLLMLDYSGSVHKCHRAIGDNESSFSNWKNESFNSIYKQRNIVYDNNIVNIDCFNCECYDKCLGGCPQMRDKNNGNKAIDCAVKRLHWLGVED